MRGGGRSCLGIRGQYWEGGDHRQMMVHQATPSPGHAFPSPPSAENIVSADTTHLAWTLQTFENDEACIITMSGQSREMRHKRKNSNVQLIIMTSIIIIIANMH